jgi:hypothetical protein
VSAPIVVRLATIDDVPQIQAVEVTAGERFRDIEDPRIARCADAPPYWTAGLETASGEQRAWVAVDDVGSIIGSLLRASSTAKATLTSWRSHLPTDAAVWGVRS